MLRPSRQRRNVEVPSTESPRARRQAIRELVRTTAIATQEQLRGLLADQGFRKIALCAHGEETPEGGPIGRVFCVDASQVDPKTLKPKLVWEYQKSQRFGLSSPAETGAIVCPGEE